MLYQNLEFHNVAALEQTPGALGLTLQRFPEAARLGMGHNDHERGRFSAQSSTCCEIRFVTDAPFFRVALSSHVLDTRVAVYCGDFLHGLHQLPAGVVTTLQVETPPRLGLVGPQQLESGRFASRLWRIVFDRGACGVFCGLETFGHEPRPPLPQECPPLRWLAYGSSITFGGNANWVGNCYAMQAARQLGVDLLNKACSGSCFCDRTIVDYLAGMPDWDFATLELGINMLTRFTAAEFRQRAQYLVDRLCGAHPHKPVVLITPFPGEACWDVDHTKQRYQDYHAFTRILREIHAAAAHPCLALLDGAQVLDDFTGLSTDLLHPSEDGHIRMGFRLAQYLGEQLPRMGLAIRHRGAVQ